MDTLTLLTWAMKHKVSPDALRELCDMSIDVQAGGETPEAVVQSQIRLEAAQKGLYLYRNNRGAGKMASGNHVRYGLANDSARVGDRFKSGDLIGLEPVLITPPMVGKVIGRFTSVEVKRGDWKFSGTKEELAQVAWAALVTANGGRAMIVNHTGAL